MIVSNSNLAFSLLPCHKITTAALFTFSIPFVRPPKSRCCYRRPSWDSNAESVRAGKFGFGDESKKRWWTEEDDIDDEDDFDEEDDFDGDEGPVKETLWDMFWILKVFKAYGYLLPAIIASFLLATGPKAFLMALALPLGQSAISLAINKIWGKEPERPRAKKPFTRYSGDYDNYRRQRQDDNYDDNARPGYQTWVSPDNAGGSSQSSSSSSLGGWDELDAEDTATNAYAGLKPSSPKVSAKSQSMKKGKLAKKGRYRDVPLFLRLLIAIFPFLGSWTKIL